MRNNNASYFRRGLRVGIPISLGYMAVAFALGISCKSAGMNALQSGFMSAGMLASAGEYAAVTLIGSCAGALEMITTTIIVNLRYLLMGSALSQKIGPDTPLVHRFLLSYCITDEIFGVCSSVEGNLVPSYAYGCTLISAIGWVAGTVGGVLAGSILPAWLVNALSVALYGMFLAVIIPAARKDRFIAGVVLLSMLSSYLFSAMPVLNRISDGFRIILLTLLIAGAAALIRPIDPDTGKPCVKADKERSSS
ncbi:MAG: AzlC family ABC transporter permease [Lachnospiraceae bacterium]|nr:AzlC family ABC transporter permease [Lachnospiraceae bacterium]